MPHEFVRVECQSEGQEVHRDFHGFVRARPRAHARPPRGLNVLLLGADNLSRLNLLRSMPGVSALLQRMGAINMLGYNKVRVIVVVRMRKPHSEVLLTRAVHGACSRWTTTRT